MANIDSDLPCPLNFDTQCEILKNLWECDSELKKRIIAGDVNPKAYFQYYAEQCNLALYDGGNHTSARTHLDILSIAKQLRQHSSRDCIFQGLRSQGKVARISNGDEMINGSIDLAARLLVMVDIGGLVFGFSGRRPLVWKSGSLKGFLEAHFNKPAELVQEHVKLEKMFNARNLSRIAGIKIIWTNNLANHLRMMDEDRKVAIFRHAFFLEYQQSDLFPDGFIDETVRTLALLFPQSDLRTRKWLRKMWSFHTLDQHLMKCGQLRADDRRIENFKYWHDRLVTLKQVFDEAQPSTLAQWWCDRRNGVQWYTFWVAVLVLALTMLFGLIQSIEAALQVYKAFYPTPCTGAG